MPDSVNFTFADSLTSSNGCPNYNSGSNGTAQSNAFRATYQAGIANRLNVLLNGLALNTTDIGVMQDLCGFQAEINDDTRFCNVFEGRPLNVCSMKRGETHFVAADSEWLDYEYANDLNYYYG
jgi:acid phosphatase